MSLIEDAAATIVADRHGSPDAPKLLVIHGIGSKRLAWSPVVDQLAEHFDLVVLDLPGFGESPLLPAGLNPNAPTMAAVLAAFMDSLGWKTAHLLGNSLGGWLSLELAVMGRADSVTAVAPAGLWPKGAPLNAQLPLGFNRYAAKAFRPALGILRNDRVRKVAIGSLFGQPVNVPGDHAVQHAQGFADNKGFAPVKRALAGTRFEDGRSITVPLTVIFGPKDRIITRKQSELTKLPSHTRYETPAGWGHVPMYDDPAGLVQLVRETADV